MGRCDDSWIIKINYIPYNPDAPEIDEINDFFSKIFTNESVKNYVLDILAIKYSPDETAGPIPKAKITVPIPMVPPRDQPILMTVNSKKTRTQAIGKPVTLWQPVINPSLGPGPRFAIR